MQRSMAIDTPSTELPARTTYRRPAPVAYSSTYAQCLVLGVVLLTKAMQVEHGAACTLKRDVDASAEVVGLTKE